MVSEREPSPSSGSSGRQAIEERRSLLRGSGLLACAGSIALAIGIVVAACSLSLDGYDNGVCPSGQKACFRACVPMTDPDAGCGAPGCSACDIQGARPICNNGACAIGICEPGLADCDQNVANGCEADLNNELHNCGTCGAKCPPATGHVLPVCNSGTCHTICETGWVTCGSSQCGCQGTCQMGTCTTDAGSADSGVD
jgi:hypothetical protein